MLGAAQAARLGGHHRRRRRARRAGSRRAVRRLDDLADQLHLAGARAGARHGGPAARADALLHRAHRQGSPPLGGVGDRPHRRLLPVHPGAGLRRRGAGRARRASWRPRAAELGGACCSRSSSAGWSCSASSRRWPSRRSSRWSPGLDHHRGDVVRARHLRQRDRRATR